jgi:hypothetical protein
MLAKVILFACSTILLGTAAVNAQATAPAELPSADYEGQSYVDSKGCIFLRAGYGGDATWVPRVGKDRKQICGQTPSNALSTTAKPAKVAEYTLRKAKVRKRSAPAAPHVPVLIGCPVSVPVARRYATTDGGSVVICTAKNGSLTGARSPIYPQGSGVGPALSATSFAGVDIPLPKARSAVNQISASVAPPAGYEAAGPKGRFNPMRGKGTAAGQAAQDGIWTRDVPAEEISATVKAVGTAKSVLQATSSATGGKLYVQVGTFGEPTNADGARVRLQGLGLPVANGKFTKQGKALQVVYSGPFASVSEAQSALLVARSGGFSDAFIR